MLKCSSKTTKYFVAIVLIIAMMLSACGKEQNSTVEKTTSNATENPASNVAEEAGNSAASSQVSENSAAEADGSETAEPSGEVKDIAFATETMFATSYDPASCSKNDQFYLQMVYASLMKLNVDTFELEPYMAEGYDVSEDGLTYTFHLRQGVQFQKGYGEMKASDVVFTYERLVDPETASKNASDFEMVESVTAVDDYTVEYKLKHAFAPFPYLLSDQSTGAFITSQKAVEEFGDEFNKNPIGTGPFQLQEWSPQQYSVLASNPDFYDEPPLVNVTVREIKDGNTSLMALQQGEIQAMVSNQLEIVQQAEALSGVELITKAVPVQYGVYMNVKEKPLDDVRVRQAIAYAINREENRKVVFGDKMASASHGYVPSLLKGYTEEGVTQYEYDPEKAKALLAEAGYPDGFDLEAKINNDARNTRIFTLIQNDLAQVGINLTVTPLAAAEWTTWNYSGDAVFGYFPMARVPEIYFFMNGYYDSVSVPPSSNCSYYSGIDDLLKEAATAGDWETREELYKQAQQQLSQDVPWLILHEVNCTIITSEKVKGLYVGGALSSDVRFDKAYVAE